MPAQTAGNTARGARLDNAWGPPPSPNTIAISDSQFNQNTGNGGLYAVSSGLITLANVTAGYYDELTPISYGNTGYGVYLDNTAGTAGVTLTGINTFNANASAGLLINAWGPVIVNNLTAHDNGCDLTKEDDYLCDGAGINAGSSILLTGYGRFSKNYDDDFVANAWNAGAVTLNNLYADKNGWKVDQPGSVERCAVALPRQTL